MKRATLPDSVLIPVVSDGAIATAELGEGRLIPVLVIDCGSRPEVRDMIYAHEHLPPGDVKVTWCTKLFNKRAVYLYLQFERPARVEVLFEFDIEKQSGLVDGILHARGAYLQPRESGEDVVAGLDKIKILVEVPDTGFMPTWDLLFRRMVKKKMRKRGLNRRVANDATEQYIERIREFWAKRTNV